MPPLSQLAKTQQSTSVGQAQMQSTASAGGTSIQANQQINNNAGLAKDIGKMFGGLVQSHQEASEYAGKRVGVDNLVSYKRELGQLDAMYANMEKKTSSDMVEKSRLEQGLYETYMQKGVFQDNALANQAFKDTYATPAGEKLLALKKQNNDNRVALFKDETQKDITYAIGYIGEDINSPLRDTFRQQYTDAGLDPYLVDGLILDRKAESLQAEINTNHGNYADAGGNVREGAVDELINNIYGMYSNSEDKSIVENISEIKVKASNFIDAKAKETKSLYEEKAIATANSLTFKGTEYTDDNGVTHKFAKTHEEFNKEINSKYPLLDKTTHEQIMNMYKVAKEGMSGYASAMAKDFEYRIKRYAGEPLAANKFVTPETLTSYNQEGIKLMNSGILTPSQSLSVKYAMESVQDTIYDYNIISNSLKGLLNGSIDSSTMKDYALTGMQRPDGVLVKNDTVQSYIKNELSSMQTNAEDIDTSTDEGVQSFQQELVKIQSTQDIINGGVPKLFNKYDRVLSDRTSLITMSGQDIERFTAYIDYKVTSNPKEYSSYSINVAKLKSYMKNQSLDTETSPEIKENTLRAFAISALKWQDTPNNAKSLWDKQIENLKTGTGRWKDIWDTDVAGNLSNVMMSMYKGTYTEDDMKRYMDSFETYDIPTRFGLNTDTARMLKPRNMENNEVTALLDLYLKPEGLTFNDISPVSYEHVSDDGSVSMGYRIMRKTSAGTLEVIGNINKDAYNKIKVK